MLHSLDPVVSSAKNLYKAYHRYNLEKPIEESFKDKYSFDRRINESTKIIEKYPERIPIIVERFNRSLPDIDRKKYLAPSDLSVGNFMYVIRKRIKLQPEKSLFLFFDEKILPVNTLLGCAYDNHKDKDGFLYIKYCEETTFG